MSINRTAIIVPIISGAWLAVSPLAMGQSPDCPPWDQRQPAQSPRSYRNAMSYDTSRGVSVLVGNGTWEWDGATWKTADIPTPGGSYPILAYDESREVSVLFDGGTWEWNGAKWILRESGVPSWRGESAMAYDAARGVTILFGGRADNRSLGDTWEWDGTKWELRSTTGPAPRFDHAMAYDSDRHVTVLYGGVGGSGTWEWDGVVWVRRTPFISPGFRLAHSMVYDSTRGVTLLFSGLGPGSPNSETWEWDGTSWTLFSEVGPPGRMYAGMAYDSARGVTVLFGGVGIGPLRILNDTWELPSCPVDSDGDGVFDPDDDCDLSDLRDTILVDDCDTGVSNQLFDDGCTMADRIAECAEGARNHGAFVSCVTHLTNEWARDGVITSREKGPIQRCTAQSDLPLPDGVEGRPTKGESASRYEALWRR